MLKLLINWFLPRRLANNTMAADYDEVYTLVLACIAGVLILPAIYLALLFAGYHIEAILYNGIFSLALLFFIQRDIIKIPTYIMGLCTYVVYFRYIADTGGIYSPLVGFLYIYLIGAYWGHRNSGAVASFLNIAVLILLFYGTPPNGIRGLGSALGTLLIHISGNALLGILMWMVQIRQDKAREEIKQLQKTRIDQLDAEVAKRTQQLNNIRQSLATDFHDETGNLLSAISIQASMLKLRIPEGDPSKNIVDSIISNSNELYASSKHFLWNLNNNSQDPDELFQYLTSFGQSFYNQFDVSFSATRRNIKDLRLDPFVSLNLVFIFKEAMNNVVKHSGATEVVLDMNNNPVGLQFALKDNGIWKKQEQREGHYGLANMQKRCAKHHLLFSLFYDNEGTVITVTVPYPEPYTLNQSV